MPRLKNIYASLAATAFLCFGQIASADNPLLKLDMGQLKIFQKYGAFVKFELKNGEIIQVEDKAGTYWPPINMSSRGVIYLGDKVIDSASGTLIRDEKNPNLVAVGGHLTIIANNQRRSISLVRDGRRCEIPLRSFGERATDQKVVDLLKDTSLRFVDSDGPLVVLVTSFGSAPSDTTYRILTIAQDACRIDSSVNIGNPDYLVELGWSPEGHWWIIGSTENTLLRSSDGKAWTTIRLPETISELTSAYVSDSKEIWLAAVDSRLPLDAGPLLINSKDGGNSWVPLTWDSPLMKELPKYWLEGQMRAHGKETSERK